MEERKGVITKEQIKRLYALGAGLGLVDRHNQDDHFHVLVMGLTGKNAVSTLTEGEFRRGQSDLLGRMKDKKRMEPLQQRKKQHPEQPGGMTADQQRKAWAVMYRLRDLDTSTRSASLGDRMCGIIRKEMHRDCTAEDPFHWLTMQDGWKLIEILKKYLANAERKGGARDRPESEHG